MEFFDCKSKEELEELATEFEAGCQVEGLPDEQAPAQSVNLASRCSPIGVQPSQDKEIGQDMPQHDDTIASRSISSGIDSVGPKAEDTDSLNFRNDQAPIQHDHTIANRSISSWIDSVGCEAEDTLDSLSGSNDQAPTQQGHTFPSRPIPVGLGSTSRPAKDPFDDLAALDEEYKTQDGHAISNHPDTISIGSDMVDARYLTPYYDAFANREGLIEREFASHRAIPVLPGEQPTQPAAQRSGGTITSYGKRSCLVQNPRYGRPENMIYDMDSAEDNAGRDANFRITRFVPANSEDEPVSGSDAEYYTGTNVGPLVKHVRFVLPSPDDPPEPVFRESDDSSDNEGGSLDPFHAEYYEESDSDEDNQHVEDVEHAAPKKDTGYDADDDRAMALTELAYEDMEFSDSSSEDSVEEDTKSGNPFTDPSSFLGPASFRVQESITGQDTFTGLNSTDSESENTGLSPFVLRGIPTITPQPPQNRFPQPVTPQPSLRSHPFPERCISPDFLTGPASLTEPPPVSCFHTPRPSGYLSPRRPLPSSFLSSLPVSLGSQTSSEAQLLPGPQSPRPVAPRSSTSDEAQHQPGPQSPRPQPAIPPRPPRPFAPRSSTSGEAEHQPGPSSPHPPPEIPPRPFAPRSRTSDEAQHQPGQQSPRPQPTIPPQPPPQFDPSSSSSSEDEELLNNMLNMIQHIEQMMATEDETSSNASMDREMSPRDSVPSIFVWSPDTEADYSNLTPSGTIDSSLLHENWQSLILFEPAEDTEPDAYGYLSPLDPESTDDEDEDDGSSYHARHHVWGNQNGQNGSSGSSGRISRYNSRDYFHDTPGPAYGEDDQYSDYIARDFDRDYSYDMPNTVQGHLDSELGQLYGTFDPYGDEENPPINASDVSSYSFSSENRLSSEHSLSSQFGPADDFGYGTSSAFSIFQPFQPDGNEEPSEGLRYQLEGDERIWANESSQDEANTPSSEDSPTEQATNQSLRWTIEDLIALCPEYHLESPSDQPSSDNSPSAAASVIGGSREPSAGTLSPDALRDSLYHWRDGHHCSHELMVRYFAPADGPGLLCGCCFNYRRYLWVCAADTPAWSAYDPSGPSNVPRWSVDVLSDSVKRAVAEGQYTNSQVVDLVGERVRVLTEAQATREFYGDGLTASPEEQVLIHGDIIVPSLSQTRHDGAHGPEGATEDEIYRLYVSRASEFTAARVPCRQEICGVCRSDRSCVERATGQILGVVEAPFMPLPGIPEYLNRSVSSAEVLSGWEWSDGETVESWVAQVRGRAWFQESWPDNAQSHHLLRLSAHLSLRRLSIFELFDWVDRQSLTLQELIGVTRWMILQRFNAETVHFYCRTVRRGRVSDPNWYRQMPEGTATIWTPEDRGRRCFKSGSSIRTPWAVDKGRSNP